MHAAAGWRSERRRSAGGGGGSGGGNVAVYNGLHTGDAHGGSSRARGTMCTTTN